jgi:kynurenine 3-monooxygenase
MCRPDIATTNDNGLRHVIISGAGPAGLLLAVLLLQRNEELTNPLYKVTLVDNREDLGVFSTEELKQRHRSWMLGLAGHGIQALKQVDEGNMYKEYCQKVGIQLDSLSLHLGAKEIVQGTVEDLAKEGKPTPEGFIVDRNFIVASLARYVRDLDNVEFLTTLYEHKIQYVDYDNLRVLVRNLNTREESYMPYDLLVGCDGARSVVREALVKRHSNFEMDVGDIFQTFKAVHVQRPANVKPSSMHLLPACFPNMQGIALPETGDMLNISMGIPRHLFDTPALAPELKSDDPEVVAQYVKENFKAFELIDYDDFAQQWVNQRWNHTAQVHCNFYHSSDINVVLMGDAAHATSPSIGMGMNTALRDAQQFYLLLQKHKDDFTQVLPAFSEERVKEGNSLSDLAMHLYCMDTTQQMVETIHMVVRTTLHKWFPRLVQEHPQALIGLPEYKLCDVYDVAMQLGIMQKHRAINQKIRQEYFERSTGMVVTPASKWPSMKTMVMAASGLVAVGAMAYGR